MNMRERTALDVFLDRFDKFEERDQRWKDGIDAWRRTVEEHIISDATRSEARREATLDRRARITVILSAVGSLGALVFSLLKG